MKQILWVMYDKEVTFKVNWLEYIILEKIFEQKRYKIMNVKRSLKGESYNTVIVDEASNLDNKGKILFVSTPIGRNVSIKEMMENEDRKEDR